MSDGKEPRFADLIGEFVEQLVEAAQASYVRQLESAVQLRALVELPLEDYARQHVSENDVADERQRRGASESDGDQLRLEIAARERSFVQGVIKEGMPRCIIDTALLNLKFRFSLDSETATPAAPLSPGGAVPTPPPPRPATPGKEPQKTVAPANQPSRLDQLNHTIIKRALAAKGPSPPRNSVITVQAIDIKNAGSDSAHQGECAVELRFRVLYD